MSFAESTTQVQPSPRSSARSIAAAIAFSAQASSRATSRANSRASTLRSSLHGSLFSDDSASLSSDDDDDDDDDDVEEGDEEGTASPSFIPTRRNAVATGSRPPKLELLTNIFRRAQAGERPNIPLAEPELLRGTTPAVLLQGFGRRLRKSTGGLGCGVVENGDSEYNKSFEVPELDVFLSHSWHAPWHLKYCLLLLHFNSGPAIMASISAGVVCSIFSDASVPGQDKHPECIHKPYEWLGLGTLIGLATFMAVILGWHNISSGLPCLRTSIFLDKVCIHQTDMAKKERGIMNIGAILNQANMMLVAYDPSYLERLWCVFELSVFKIAGRQDRLIIRSMALTTFLGAMIFICNGTLLIVHLCATPLTRYSIAESLLSAFLLAPLFPLIFTISTFTRERRDLKRRLKAFTAKTMTKCFCCQVDHKHPDTGAPLLCDRNYVYNFIAQWYGGGNQQRGLKEFDKRMKGELKADLHHSLGKFWHIPYYYVLLVGLPAFHLYLSWSYRCMWLNRVTMASEYLFLRFPLLTVVILAFSDFLHSTFIETWVTGVQIRSAEAEATTWVQFILAGVATLFVIAGVWNLLGVAASTLVAVFVPPKIYQFPEGHLLFSPSYLLWVAGETVAVLLFYVVFPRRYWGVKRQVRQVGNMRPVPALRSIQLATRRADGMEPCRAEGPRTPLQS